MTLPRDNAQLPTYDSSEIRTSRNASDLFGEKSPFELPVPPGVRRNRSHRIMQSSHELHR